MPQHSHPLLPLHSWNRRLFFLCIIPALVSSILLPQTAWTADQEAPPSSQVGGESHIDQLIGDLGAAEPLIREHAEEELLGQGMIAFEALQDAAQHEDIEIRLRAQRVLDRLRKTAMTLEVEPALQLFLGNIWGQNPARRAKMIELALRAEPSASLPAACQIVRFEKSDVLSKQVAVLIMNQVVAENTEALAERQRTILDAIGTSRRDASKWLRSYALSLSEPQNQAPEFARFYEHEQQVRQFERDGGNPLIIQELREIQLAMLLRAGLRDEFREHVLSLAKERVHDRRALWQLLQWLSDLNQPQLITQLYNDLPDPFQKDRLLVYRAAAAAAVAGNSMAAEEWAKAAYDMPLTPTDDNPTSNGLLYDLYPREPENRVDPHWVAYYIGDTLMDLGLFDWGERELHRIIDDDSAWTRHKFFAATSLAESLHDRGLHAAAAKISEKVGRGIEENTPEVLQVFQDLIQEPGETAARWRYFQARAALVDGNFMAAQDHLRKAIENSSADSDVLIAMYRMPNASPEWKEFTQQQIQRSITNYRLTIREAQAERTERSQPIQTHALIVYHLSQALNQFAWLVGNTEGDIDEAIRMSRESMTIDEPSGSQLDTLGRCYYRAGDLPNALRCQQQAVRLMPHSVQIRKQLDLFESEAKAKP